MKIYLRIIAYSFFLFCFLPCMGFAAETAPYTVQCSWIEKGKDNILCVSLEPQDGYYTYAPLQKNVYPTQISLAKSSLTENLPEIPVLFPFGAWKEDTGSGQKIRVFDGTTRIYLLFPQKYTGDIEISLLACSKEHCQPFTVQKNVSAEPSFVMQDFSYKNELDTLLSAYAQHTLAKEQISFAGFKQVSGNRFSQQKGISSEKSEQDEQSRQIGLEAFSLETLKEKAEHESSKEKLEQNKKQPIDFSLFSARPFYQELEVRSLVKALLFGVLAGFILNFMPCVLPVIALKLHALLSVPGQRGQTEQGIHFFREQMLFFALGILSWFVVLAFLFGGLGLTWGQLFQEYWLMLGLCILVFVLALSLFDVFHLPVINLRNYEQKNARLDTFLSGFLATILATPCSGPLLGGVLAFVLTQSFVVIVLVFLCMGFGMALPYLVFACKPGFASFMPKAGNWLLVMEKMLAFFLLGTALYLFSLLPDFLHMKVLCFLFVFCICSYIWGKWAGVYLAKMQKFLTFLGLCFCVVLCFWYLFMQAGQKENIVYWQDFQAENFMQDLGQKTLLVKFTADWCPTCKVLEQTVFTEKNIQELSLLAPEKIQFILVDMTEHAEEKQAFLTSLGSASIPFLAVFPENNPYQPFIVRDIYTLSTVQQILKKAVAEENE